MLSAIIETPDFQKGHLLSCNEACIQNHDISAPREYKTGGIHDHDNTDDKQ